MGHLPNTPGLLESVAITFHVDSTPSFQHWDAWLSDDTVISELLRIKIKLKQTYNYCYCSVAINKIKPKVSYEKILIK